MTGALCDNFFQSHHAQQGKAMTDVHTRPGNSAPADPIETIAAEAFAALGGCQIAPFSQRYSGFDLDAAYRVTAAVRRLREARGERVIGRKIGFTNRTIWAEYNVFAPIWGYVYDRTVHDLAEAGDGFPIADLAEPRIEPEIVFGLARAPAPGMTMDALLGCIGWIAHGFEIVQSIFPGWIFAPADTVAAYGLHGALLIGPRQPLGGRNTWLRELETFDIALSRNGAPADRGCAANVLDGPLHALRHLVDLLARDPVNAPLAAGEIVTTGTLTRALPVAAGETWTTELAGIPLPGSRLRFA
jgi:2-oxo-3-hexenedioate decarboxylase